MKNSILYIVLLISCLTNAQNYKQQNQLVQAEMKSFSARNNLTNNPNTSNYNITYHKLEFTVNPTQYFISGKITTTFTALSNMNTMTFDKANELIVSSVKMGATNLSFIGNANNELVITLPNTINIGTSATVEVTYSGAPPVNGFRAFTQELHAGAPIIYTLSEPYGARDWWPCKQDLNDKINSIDVFITAPSQFVAVSNGIEPEAPVIIGGNKTTHFHHGYAIPAYLICMSVTNYQIYNQVGGTAPNQYPIINYLYPEDAAGFIPQLSQTPLILNLFENLYEIYPYKNEKYGHAQFGWGGGMEHTTVSSMIGFSRGLVAHEMAHQWFGNKITCGTWKDIWLNESFATYVAAQVTENFDGIPEFVQEKQGMIDYITSEPDGNVYLTDTQITSVNSIFNYRTSYVKGAMVLEMLRFKMGDTMFFQAIKNYLADVNLAYNYAITTDLQSHLEAVYGSSLQEFFDDWVYNEGYPSYTIDIQKINANQTSFTINQIQSHPSVSYFEMPVPITVFGAGGQSQNVLLQNTTNGQVILENIPFEVTTATFDPDKHLISNENTLNILPSLSNQSFDVNLLTQIYPNPSNDFINIKTANGNDFQKIIIYNALGQMILTSNLSQINIQNLSNGVYYTDIETTNGTSHKKFIKK